MIGTIAFVLGFVTVGLTVVLLAMRGGPRGVRQGLHTQTRRGSRGTNTVSIALMLAFGAGIPFWVMAANSANAIEDAPGGLTLSASQAEGRKSFAINCGMCHTLKAAAAVGKVGPNLDQMRPPKALTLNAIEQGRARGMGQMPAEVIDGEEAEHVAEFVAAVAGR